MPAPRPRLLAAAIVAAVALPGTAQAAPDRAVAPGRVAFAVDDGSVRDSVDPTGAGTGVALPDGTTLLFGSGAGPVNTIHVARIDAHGALDAAFGTGGVTTIAAPPGSPQLLQILRQPDGRLLLVSASGSASPATLSVTRLNADLSVDAGYGSGGTAVTGVDEGCGSCTPAALAADGSLVLAGTTGTFAPPPAPLDLRFAVTRLTPGGAVDTSFGTNGIATVPTTLSASGFNAAIGPGGTIVVSGQSQAGLLDFRSNVVLARLTADGHQDPAFNAGKTIELPFDSGFLMLVQDDGSVLVSGHLRGAITPPVVTAGREFVARVTPAGALDAGFGTGGVVELGSAVTPQQLLPGGGRAVLVAGTPAVVLAPGSAPVPGRIVVRRLVADGTPDPAFGGLGGRVVDIPFGGGGSSFLVSVHPRPLPPLTQNSFGGTRLLARAGGGFLVVGGVSVTQPTGEGEGRSIGRFAAGALTPSFALDPAFGGAATPPRLAISVLRQRARTARAKHGIRVRIDASAVGLARVKIFHGGRAIAQSVLPVFKTGRQTLPVELTHYGNRYLSGHRNLRVTVRATSRDLLTATAGATARGRLR